MQRIMDYTKLEHLVGKNMKPSRFEHSIGVAETSAMLLEKVGLDPEAGRICGIYHDYFRYIGADDAISEVRKHLIPTVSEELESPVLLHAPIAAFHMRDIVGSVPDSYLKAVRWHTLGSRDMGMLGAAVYIADYAEPGRKHLDDEVRCKIFSMPSFEAMVSYILEMQYEYFKTAGKTSAGVTDDLYTYLKEGGRFEN